MGLHVTEQVRARADLAAGLVGVAEAFHALLPGHVDLLDLVLADTVALALAPDRLVGDHGRDEEGPRLLDLLRGLGIDQVAVLDAADPRLHGGAHGLARVRVGEHVLAHGLRFLDGRAHLLDGVLRGVQLVARRHGAARGHDLDLVDVVAQGLARGLAHLVGAVRDDADHARAALDGIVPFRPPSLVAVPTRLREVLARDQHARAGMNALRHRLAKAVVGPARIPHRGEALQERLLHAADGLGHDEAGGQEAMLVRDVALDGAHVDVRVGQARHQCPALEVEGGDLALEGADLARADDVLDPLALDDDGGTVDGLLARAVDQERVSQNGDGH